MNSSGGYIELLPYVGWLIGLILLGCAIYCGKRQRLVNDLPTSKVLGVFIGLVEVKGTAESEDPLCSYLAERRCVHYSYSIDEHWSRTETYTDKDGHTRTRHTSGWTTVDSGGHMQDFYLQDDTGVILVRPAGATVEGTCVFEQTCTPFDRLYYGKGPSTAVMNSDHRRRFTEQAVPLHAPLYIVGQSRERADVVAPEIAQDKEADLFLISMRSEDAVSGSYRLQFWVYAILGLVAVVGLQLWFGQAVHGAENPVFLAAAAAGYLAVWSLAWVIMVYNGLVGLRNRVRQAWAQIDVQLKRRADLIPRLVQVIEGFRVHEASLQADLAALRSQISATQPGHPGADPAACHGRLVALAEAYPDLKSSEMFLDLQHQLAQTEDRIALARGYFNEITTFYNTRLEIVPDTFIARLGGLQPESLMKINGFEARPVVVKLYDNGAETTPGS